jgi:PAS domain S-box-containing protein
MKQLPGLAWIKDLNGQYVFANDAAEKAFGTDRGRLYGKRDEEIFPSAIAEQFREHDLQAISSGKGIETIEQLAHGDGLHHSVVSKFPIPGADGKPAMVGGIAIDITERMQAEAALVAVKDELAQQLADLQRLHDMSERLSTTLELQPILDDSLRTAATIENAEMGLLSLCDPKTDELRVGASLGLAAEMLATIAGIPLGDGSSAACDKARRRVIVEDIEVDPHFAPYRDTARRAGFRAVHSTPLVARSGKLVGVMSTYFRRPYRPTDRTVHLIDLCARQAVGFIENAQLYSELREADRRKDEFLATLAHELRNPLAPICNSLHLLRLSDDLAPSVQHVREIMERQVNHMVRLIDDLLEVSRIGQGKVELRRELVELSTVIGSALEISRPWIEVAGHQLAVALPNETVTLEADPTRLAQVIANLLNNAAKYTPRGGQIWLSARGDSDEIVVSVRDNGRGIPAEMLPRVFNMFAQLEPHPSGLKTGLGIGLALAKSLVQMHGGTIEATSGGAGCGSEFTVRLPLPKDARPVVVPTRVVEKATPSIQARRRILVVDDTESSAFVLGKLLETLGQQVTSVDDAHVALSLARTQIPHVVISDIAMPQMSGYELARRLRRESKLRDTVLVALSGFGQDSDRQMALDAGFDHYLVKPVSIEGLEGLLASLPPVPASSVVLLGPPVRS